MIDAITCRSRTASMTLKANDPSKHPLRVKSYAGRESRPMTNPSDGADGDK